MELGQIYICLEASMMDSCASLLREGHLEQVHHVFGNLKKCHNTELLFYPSSPDVDINAF